jgi:hypothetical protein
VLASTHGRGQFTCTYNIDLNTSNQEIAETVNPFSLFVTQAGIEIQSTVNQPADYSIYTISGTIVLKGKLEQGATNRTVNVDGLSRGVYLVQVQAGKYKLVKKVVL